MSHRPPSRRASVLAVAIVALIVLVALGGCSSSSTDAATGDTGDASNGEPAGAARTDTTAAAPAIHTEVRTAAGTTVALELATLHLAVVIDEGGSCDGPPCVEALELGAAGDWSFSQDGTTTTGAYDPAPLADLAATLDETTIASGSFLGECPTVRNGTERTYLVFHPDSPETATLEVGSCHQQLDATSPLIETLDLLVAEARRSGPKG